jgi:preprotein translocase subunit SecF
MGLWRRLYRGETTFDFVGSRRRWWTISGVLLGISILALIIFRLELSVDFTGGLVVNVPNPAGAQVEDVRNAIDPLGESDARIQLVAGGEAVRIQTGFTDDPAPLVEALTEVTGAQPGEANVESVGPTFGAQIAQRALIALVVFIGAVILYIGWRLELKMGVTAIAALIHDMIVTVGIYALFGIDVTPATVVSILTILGYSLYDSVVVFDQIKENERELHDRATYSDIVNVSMNQVLMRSINTSLSSLIPIASLLIIGGVVLGATPLNDFSLALFIGIAVGTYSSFGVAGPLLAAWKEGEEGWTRTRRRLEAKESAPPRPAGVAPPPVGPPAVRPPSGTGAAPRPPRKRKR